MPVIVDGEYSIKSLAACTYLKVQARLVQRLWRESQIDFSLV